MKTLNPYLTFNGNAAEAMRFYQSVLGGELTIQTFGEAKMAEKPEDENRTIHAVLKSNGITLMASDSRPGTEVTFGDEMHLSVVGSEEDGLDQIFAKLAEGGTIDMQLEKQFWGDMFGMCTDRFGMHWMVNSTVKK